MRIDPNRPIRPASPRRDGKSGSGTDVGFSAAVTGEHAVSGAAASRPVVSIDGLFQLQEVPDGLAQRRRAVQRGGTLLDRLDDLRMALLTGALSQGQLAELQRVVDSERGLVDDPRLIAVLDEIDLRAKVELAKLSMAS
ncbi:MAG TPA: flagellar assembly protein FliX [Stellaceae bacterium]|nr:flagellar assembly protein FliX [Stellaceae bacterium]